MKERGRIRRHIARNKPIYIGTAVGVAGVATGVILGRRIASQTVVQGIAINSPVTLTQLVTLARRGHPGTVIRDLQTGELYASISRAAEATGMNRATVRSLIGDRFEDLGDAL